MDDCSVLIIGAGAAGLAAAYELSSAGHRVGLLEARDRVGGRIYTVSVSPGDLPIDLGAEFIHGENTATYELVKRARLRPRPVPDRHWRALGGTLQRDRKFWDQLQQVIERINTAAPDEHVQWFLDHAWSVDEETKRLVKEYVEGFHAAPANRMSVHALAKAEQAGQKAQSTRMFRLRDGYSGLIGWLAGQLAARQVPVACNTVVQAIAWERGLVRVRAKTVEGLRQFEARSALITLPLGVLKLRGAEGVTFDPPLPAKEKAIEALGLASAFKLTLHFRARFWPKANFGFIHSDDPWLPTWWSDSRGPLLTAWAGGPKAERLNEQSADWVLGQATRTLSTLFKVDLQKVTELLVAGYTHNWTKDPFARCAYSYTPVRMSEAPRHLAEPVAETLFFAGEATDSDGEQGTVQAALNSGRRAARQIIDAVPVSKTPPALQAVG